MRLKKSQKEAVLRWIAEGLQSDEINERAAIHDPPFSVSRRQVTYYRQTRDADIRAIVRAGEQEALTEGLALKSNRVQKLKQLAALMEKDLLGGFLWLDQVKGVGSGDIATLVDYEEFNKGEVDAYRGVLDDIAKEVGHRAQTRVLSGPGGGPIKTEDVGLSDTDRARRILAILNAARARGDRPPPSGDGADIP